MVAIIEVTISRSKLKKTNYDPDNTNEISSYKLDNESLNDFLQPTIQLLDILLNVA